jgi:hypothetical protein
MISRAIVLAFAMIAGINFAGYQLTSSKDERNFSPRTNVNVNNKIIELFGYGGVSAGAEFLQKLMSGNEVEFANRILRVRKTMLADHFRMLRTWKNSETITTT